MDDRIFYAALLWLAIAVAGCDQTSVEGGTTEATAGGVNKTIALPASTPKVQGQTQMTTLQALLVAFQAGSDWETYSAIAGISWFDSRQPSAQHLDDSESTTLYVRSGKMALAGFYETDLPNGKVGADFDYVRGNEGKSGVTLTGGAASVDEIAVTKFYANTDFGEVIARQFSDAVRLQPITVACPVAYGSTTGEENSEKNAFYHLSLPSGGDLYFEGSVIEDVGKYSPGHTVFRFYRTKPAKRMEAMHCQEVKQS